MKLIRQDPYRLTLETPSGQTAVLYLPEGFDPEREALEQLADAASIDPDGITLATPDIHTGYGVPIGCVFASARYISPAAVGYDINCGMRLLTTPLAVKDADPVQLAEGIRRKIPLGEGQHNLRVRAASLDQILSEGVGAISELAEHKEPDLLSGYQSEELAADLHRIEDQGSMPGNPGAVSNRAKERGAGQLATLGGGNHFIEIQRVELVDDAACGTAWGLFPGQLVIMIHSGSRGFGHEVGGTFMKRAAQMAQERKLPLPNRQLAYMPLDSKDAKEYLGAMHCAANFAFVNRQFMTQLIRQVLRDRYPDAWVNTVYDVAHNIAKFELVEGRRMCIHRKGATRAFPGRLMRNTPFETTGQPVLIPGSMGTASYVLAGIESGAESLFSVNHGAGRLMSRTAAAGKRRYGKVLSRGAIREEDFRRSMAGIHLICKDRHAILEEAPAVYKDIDQVIATVAGAGLGKIVARLVPLAVLKG